MHNAKRPAAAVVGTGFIGLVHVEALRRLGVDVLGMVGTSPARVAEKAGHLSLLSAYESFDSMLADARVDVVHIASPNVIHSEQVRAALAAGKHIVCEKPLGVSSLETAELLRLARESGLVHAVNFNVRFYPQVQEARARIASGVLGDVFIVSGAYLQDWLLYDTDWNWRVERGRGGDLRAVSDIGSHWLDLVSYVLDRPLEAVSADLATFVPVRQRPEHDIDAFTRVSAVATDPVEVDTDDAACLLLRWAGGVRGALTVSQVSAGRKNALSVEVSCASGSLHWNSERQDELWLGHRDRANETLLRDPSLLHPAAAAIATMPGGHGEGFENTFRQLYAAIYSDVRRGGPASTPTYPTFADGHRSALILDAIAASAAEGRWIEIDAMPTEVTV